MAMACRPEQAASALTVDKKTRSTQMRVDTRRASTLLYIEADDIKRLGAEVRR